MWSPQTGMDLLNLKPQKPQYWSNPYISSTIMLIKLCFTTNLLEDLPENVGKTLFQSLFGCLSPDSVNLIHLNFNESEIKSLYERWSNYCNFEIDSCGLFNDEYLKLVVEPWRAGIGNKIYSKCPKLIELGNLLKLSVLDSTTQLKSSFGQESVAATTRESVAATTRQTRVGGGGGSKSEAATPRQSAKRKREETSKKPTDSTRPKAPKPVKATAAAAAQKASEGGGHLYEKDIRVGLYTMFVLEEYLF